jgi:hypothetical protein
MIRFIAPLTSEQSVKARRGQNVEEDIIIPRLANDTIGQRRAGLKSFLTI